MKNYGHCKNLAIMPTIEVVFGTHRDFFIDYYCKKTGELCIGNKRSFLFKKSFLRLEPVELCKKRLEDFPTNYEIGDKPNKKIIDLTQHL